MSSAKPFLLSLVTTSGVVAGRRHRGGRQRVSGAGVVVGHGRQRERPSLDEVEKSML